jgi:hypothetical protein
MLVSNAYGYVYGYVYGGYVYVYVFHLLKELKHHSYYHLFCFLNLHDDSYVFYASLNMLIQMVPLLDL